jgi:hypothetical protein
MIASTAATASSHSIVVAVTVAIAHIVIIIVDVAVGASGCRFLQLQQQGGVFGFDQIIHLYSSSSCHDST